MRASESDRAVLCPHSIVAPRDLVRTTKADDAAGYGHLVHTWKELPARFPRDLPPGEWSKADVDLVERKMFAVGDRLDVAALWPDSGKHELSFAIHLTEDPPQVIWYHLEPFCTASPDEWKASFGADFLTGTLDYVGKRESGRDWIDDLKTGRWPVDPVKSRQLRSYALAMWIHRGCPGTYLVDVSITQWPKYPLDGLPVRTWHVLDSMDLEEHLEDLRYSVAHPGEALPGDHCTFCDARESFPATAWMTHYQHRALPSCAKSLASTSKTVVQL